MSAAIGVRGDYDAGACGRRRSDRRTVGKRDDCWRLRPFDGATRTEAAKIGGVGLQIVRDWVVKFGARAGRAD
jgi:hypothetical protein